MTSSPELLVAPCESRAARYAVAHWHYAARMPTPPCACYGVWESGRFIGAVVFSPGASQYMPRQFDMPFRAVTELTRVALREHAHPVSQIVPQAIAALRRDSPGLALIVSFADPSQGHHGGIYQAMSWLYLGQSHTSIAYRDRQGVLRHSRAVSVNGWRTQYGVRKRVPYAGDLERVVMPGKFRYALPLTRSVRRRLAGVALPYPPPCDRSLDGETSALRAEGAGSTPADRSRAGTPDDQPAPVA